MERLFNIQNPKIQNFVIKNELLLDHRWSSCTHEVCERQDKQSRGYNMEQPLGSVLFQEDLPENPLRLQSLPGYRKRQRLDQCMLGAQDESGAPVQKATGFSANFKWKRAAVPCSGHEAKLMLIFTRHRPQRRDKDIKGNSISTHFVPTDEDGRDRLHNHNLLQLGQWPEHLRHFSVQHFYECTRCQLGRFCPSDIPHTMIPGECRHGRWAAGTGPKAKGKAFKPFDPLALWKERADRENYETVKIHDHALPILDSTQQHYLKRLLIEAVDMAVEYIREAIKIKVVYVHLGRQLNPLGAFQGELRWTHGGSWSSN